MPADTQTQNARGTQTDLNSILPDDLVSTPEMQKMSYTLALKAMSKVVVMNVDPNQIDSVLDAIKIQDKPLSYLMQEIDDFQDKFIQEYGKILSEELNL